MTAPNSLPINYGTVDGTPIVGQVNVGTLTAQRVRVTLGGTAYVRAPPLGYPDPNPGLGAQPSLTNHPQTIAEGTTLTLFSDQSAALVDAGAASYS